ncbi:MAG TPA: LytR C-terminal domain-containing protein [Solirubrobacterales bacterium]|nr:LytR C-terminal domain-containing protein [Solirubrobacterales bacterium]
MLKLIEQIGSFAGLAAFLGLAVFALLSFSQARDIRRLREWAGSAPERDAERKEATSTVAAQRAEELRRLEESRTAERDAIAQREQRRQRREEGLPEVTRGERLREGVSGFGERLGEPRWLAAIFVVLVVVVGGAAYLLLNDSGEADGKGGGKQAAAKISPSEIEVAVLNGTAVPGLAATFGDKVENKNFNLGAVTNSSSSFAESVVMFRRGHKPEARKVSKALSIPKLELMSSEIESVSSGANVAVIVGEDNAEATG